MDLKTLAVYRNAEPPPPFEMLCVSSIGQLLLVGSLACAEGLAGHRILGIPESINLSVREREDMYVPTGESGPLTMYTRTATKIVLATAGPSSGCSMPPTNSSWLFLKARPRIDRITMAKHEMTKLHGRN